MVPYFALYFLNSQLQELPDSQTVVFTQKLYFFLTGIKKHLKILCIGTVYLLSEISFVFTTELASLQNCQSR